MKKNKKKHCYISGGMRGVLNHYDLFKQAEVELQAQGFETFNPASESIVGKEPGETPLQYLLKVFFSDTEYICKTATHIREAYKVGGVGMRAVGAQFGVSAETVRRCLA
jgi:hypothetical protein